MEIIVPVMALVALLFLIGRRMPGNSLLVAVIFGLVFALVIMAVEQAGLWPAAWRSP